MKRCNHDWRYVHCVYSGDITRRWCPLCGTKQTGKVSRWRREREGRFDQTPHEAARQIDKEDTP